MKKFLLVALALAGALVARAAENTLTPAEKADGWQLLFDGRTFEGWRGYRLKGLPPVGWKIADGMIQTVPAGKYVPNPADPTKQGVELMTTRQFTDFEFSWEWRIAPGGNNGVKYLVTEDHAESPGLEYQMLDDTGDAKRAWRGEVHRTAALYDLIPPAADKPLRPAGEWNQSRILVKGTRVEHWLNGRNVLTYELGGPEVKSGLAKSKFTDVPGFGDKRAGHLLLTYQPHLCSYRNLKLRELR